MDSDERLGNEIAELAAHLDSATQQLLSRIRAFDETGGWERQGAISCAHWLSWRLGLDTGTAREKVRVARALGTLPAIDDAFARGTLSYAKVRALTRVAKPENEARLLQLASQATGAQLERICRGYRQVARTLTDEGPMAEERTVRECLLPGGMVKLELVLSPDEAALVLQAIDKARENGYHAAHAAEDPHVSAGTSEPAVSRADAVMLMVESFLASGPGSGTSGDRHQVFVHLDQEVLAADGEWSAALEDGTRLSAEALRRVACDAAVVPTVSDGTEVLTVGRRTRTIPSAIRRALWLRDRGCRFPGCRHTRFLHGHHIHHWLHGGHTSLANLVLLCPRHHRLVHEGGFAVEVQGDAIEFRAPSGRRLEPVPPAEAVEGAVERLKLWAVEREIEIDADTNLPSWDGAIPDYDWAVSSLLET